VAQEIDTREVHISKRRGIVIILLSLALLAVIINHFLSPLRQSLSDRFVSRGDSYMQSLDFPSAAKEYHKAVSYVSSNNEAATRERYASIAQVDIAAAKPLFEELHIDNVLNILDQAQANFPNPKEALKEGVLLYSEKKYVYAQYSLQKAIQLDPEYPEAWHYLGLTYQKLGEIDPDYQNKSLAAFRKRDALTPTYLENK
jgi:tetratricopeptide (TPR) repeat protein